MERLFEASVKIGNNDYYFDISSSLVDKENRYGANFSTIKNEIIKFFSQGYDDNQKGKGRQTNFPIRFKTDGGPFITHLKNVFKQAYNYGYKKYDEDQKNRYNIGELKIQDPILESKIKILIDQTYSKGFFDGKRGNVRQTKIDIESEIFFINNINKFLLKVYNDGYEKGNEIFNLKYKFEIPKINDNILEEKIKKEIHSAYSTGLLDFEYRKQKKEIYSVSLNFIDDELLKQQISSLINNAYQDGYNFNEKQNKILLEKKRKKENEKKQEKKDVYNLIKKLGEPIETKFTSVLYKYVSQNSELKIKENYEFNIKGITAPNVLKEVTKIINTSFYKGQQDAINGLKKEFFVFSIPYGIKDQLTKNEFTDLVNKAYNDGYQKIINEISSGISSYINKNQEKEKLDELLEKNNFNSIRMIKNLPDRYLNQKVYSVEVPNEY